MCSGQLVSVTDAARPRDVDIRTRYARTKNNNNNNSIWRGTVLTGEEPPPHSGELNHALSQSGGQTQSQQSRPLSSGHHISTGHRPRRKHLCCDSMPAMKLFARNTRKKKKKKHFQRKNHKWKNDERRKKNMKAKSNP